MIIDGRAIAKEILEAVHAEVLLLGRTPIVRAVVMEPSAATLAYLRVKSARAQDAGMQMEVCELPPGATEEDFRLAICAPGADAVIVQLPLPVSINTKQVLQMIPAGQDADVLSDIARAGAELLPPVAGAVKEILARGQVEPRGTHAVVVGEGWLVGAPVAAWLLEQGAEVTVLTSESGTAAFSVLSTAGIIVSGAGVPGLIRPEQLSPGTVLIDAGTSEQGGMVVGDADPACCEVAAVFTPVPGGVGPIAVACLFRNVLQLAKKAL